MKGLHPIQEIKKQPHSGNQETSFTFSVEYSDADNQEPQFVNVMINGNEYEMEKQDPFDNNAIDGMEYYYEACLNFDDYQFRFICSDGLYENNTDWIEGPEVSPFYDIEPITLIFPSGNSLYNGYNEFSWESLNCPFGAVNYTLQISSVADFSNISYEIHDIFETNDSTKINLLVNLSENIYYWRVSPVWGKLNGTWSEIQSFQIIKHPLFSLFDPFDVLLLVIGFMSITGAVSSISYAVKHKSKKKGKIKEKVKKLPHKPNTSKLMSKNQEKVAESERLKLIIKEIQNGFPPPVPEDSPTGYKALTYAINGFNLLEEGQNLKALYYMHGALKLGVREPENSHLKRIIFDLAFKNN
jgi:hypothetical protein